MSVIMKRVIIKKFELTHGAELRHLYVEKGHYATDRNIDLALP